jgi:hypothetical protein
MSQKRLNQIDRQIERIKQQLSEIQLVRPGSLTRQYKDPEKKTGGFYQLSYTYKMKSKTEYVRPQHVAELKKQIKTYRKFKTLIEKWVELSIEYSKLKMKLNNLQNAK